MTRTTADRRASRRTSATPNVRRLGAGFLAYAMIGGELRQEYFPNEAMAMAQVTAWAIAHPEQGLPRYETPGLEVRKCGFCGLESVLVSRYKVRQKRGAVCTGCKRQGRAGKRVNLY